VPTDESVTQIRTLEAESDKVFAAWIRQGAWTEALAQLDSLLSRRPS